MLITLQISKKKTLIHNFEFSLIVLNTIASLIIQVFRQICAAWLLVILRGF